MLANISVGMTPEMVEDIDEEARKLGISRSRYIRAVLKNSVETPFDPADIDIRVDDTDAEEAQMGGA
jgi:metal-responsive CopG/Arc/MetJ family transcriptional regulator